ncbi:hypothetical protein [Hufsiella ginkgonis]|uniref:Uncharacterized protein n=1 Tax=Hufsiella ginkgonis TaxID=2695274 RepID=A0A7K1XV02_9SPHI|nr:hypothetical protein [Hufsiella ginkgonis]MXV14326.1 hypothetical protein [Hufsiella ginkgonis]
MKFTLDYVRKGLERNKIFFEVIVAIVLTGMGIVVSIEANHIADTQTKIMRQENLPQFELIMEQEENDSLNIKDNDILHVFNRGGRLVDFEFDHVAFLNFTRWRETSSDTLRLPLRGYYNMGGNITGNDVGEVFNIDNDHNGLHEVRIRNAFYDAKIAYPEVETFAKLSYKDMFGDTHEEYFKTKLGISRITRQEWLKVESLYKESRQYYFPGLSVTELVKYASTGDAKQITYH